MTPGPAVVVRWPGPSQPARTAARSYPGAGFPAGPVGATSCGQPFSARTRGWRRARASRRRRSTPSLPMHTTTCAAHPVDAPEGEAHHGRNWRHRGETARGGSRDAGSRGRRPVRGRAARHHQALPRRRGQPGHRAEGPPRRGARDRGGERRRQVDADEDAVRRAPPRRGRDPHRRPGADLPQPVRRDRRRHRHGPPALHAGRQLHRPGEHRPGQRADARRPAGPRRGAPPDPRDLRPVLPGPAAGRPRGGPGRGCPPAGRDRQGALPRRPHPDPGRADRRPGAARGRRAVRQPQAAHPRGPDRPLHLPQARRGAPRVRRHHRHPPGHDRRHRRPEDHHRPAARRDDGRLRAAVARDPHVDGPRHARPDPRAPHRGDPRGASADRRHRPDRARGRGRRDRRGRGQRPGGTGRRHHGPAAAGVRHG